MYANATDFEDNYTDNAINKAREKLLWFPLWKLQKAEIYCSSSPDVSNPPGYYHLWVTMVYHTWFGAERRKTLYFEATAFDDSNQRAVAQYAESALAQIQRI